MVSIIMPTYNSATYIVDAVQSVLQQTYQNWELFIIDDGSTDITKDIIKPFLTNNKIRYIFQDNSGPAKARNSGIKIASGNYIAFLDSDDMWQSNKLEQQISAFQQNPNVGVCGTGEIRIGKNGEFIKYCKNQPFLGCALPGLITTKISIGLSTAIVTKKVVDQIGLFDESLKGPEDFDFWLRAALVCDFIILKYPLTLYRTGHCSVTTEHGDARRDVVLNTIIPRFLSTYGGNKFVKNKHVSRLRSSCYKDRGDSRKGFRQSMYWYLKSLLNYPYELDTWSAILSKCRWLILSIFRR